MNVSHLLECSFLIPVARSDGASDKCRQNQAGQDWLIQSLVDCFDRVYRSSALYDGVTGRSEPTKLASSRFQLFFVPVSNRRLDELRRVLHEACAVFDAEEIYLSIAGAVEYIRRSTGKRGCSSDR